MTQPGSSRSPAPGRPKAQAGLREVGHEEAIPNRAANMRKPAALPEENALERNSLTGSVGSAARSSRLGPGSIIRTEVAPGKNALAGGAVAPGNDHPNLRGGLRLAESCAMRLAPVLFILPLIGCGGSK